ncbi:hypothetical protein BAY61_02505 [Prauserella marina]|uniref:Uncharacterized protein n=1 Tax=Prauserella marina TaxID=530584 RepID=A0A222VJU5_9PSEU|nr:hypothetical protein [Prauserella marina]ASR34043.1 hypothetical protein BAY61_02505 [Prauserella marina]PWV82677.1 hypothetical protein DES30_102921 [Prauserella marina]SDC74497.1 hypothetical protein SAMN05421630_103457 [Prauserella marina]
MTGLPAMLRGDMVYRIHWVLGTDRLLGVCHCGAEHESEDPVELWDWLLAHPEGHEQSTAAGADPPAREFAGV